MWGSGTDEICVSGDRGSIVSSSDRGQNWTAVRKQTMRPLPPGQPVAAAAPKTAPAAPAAPASGSSALSITGTRRGDWLAVLTSWTTTRKGNTGAIGMQHTADAGKTWKEPHIEPTPAPWPGFHAFHPADDRTVYGVATFEQWDRPAEDRQRVGLIVSRDGGATFERRSFLPRGGGVNALWRDSTGPLIAVGPLGLILRSRDDGRTWEESSTHPFGTATLRSSWADGAGQVWIVGDDCTVLHSSDGGSRFEPQRPCPAGAGTDVRSVWGSSAEDVYIAGSFVSRTVDRGMHWAVVSPPAPVAALWHVWGSDPTDLYAAGYGVWRSTDNAQSWRMVNGSRSRTPADEFGGMFGIGKDRFSFTDERAPRARLEDRRQLAGADAAGGRLAHRRLLERGHAGAVGARPEPRALSLDRRGQDLSADPDAAGQEHDVHRHAPARGPAVSAGRRPVAVGARAVDAAHGAGLQRRGNELVDLRDGAGGRGRDGRGREGSADHRRERADRAAALGAPRVPVDGRAPGCGKMPAWRRTFATSAGRRGSSIRCAGSASGSMRARGSTAGR